MEHNTLYKFYSKDCQPCKQLSAIMESMSYHCNVKNIDVFDDKNTDLIYQCKVRAVPTLVYVDTFGVAHTKTGMMSRENLQNWLDSVV